MKIIGIDADTQDVGTCVITDDVVTEFQTWKLSGRTYEQRAMGFYWAMNFYSRGHRLSSRIWPNPNAWTIAIEQVNVARNLDTVRKLAYLVGLLAASFGQWPVIVNTAAAYSVVGLSTTLGRDLLKQMVRHHVTAICQGNGWPVPADEHQANAYCVAEWARIHKGEEALNERVYAGGTVA